MRSVTTVGLLSGPLVLLCYLLGSATRWRNPFSRATADGTTAEPGPGAPDAAGPAALAPRTQLVVDVGLVLVAYVLAEQVTRAVAPGVTFSLVASLSFQVLFVWDSVALWCALAAVVGSVAPPWTAFRGGGDGVAAVAALLVISSVAPGTEAYAKLGKFTASIGGTGSDSSNMQRR